MSDEEIENKFGDYLPRLLCGIVVSLFIYVPWKCWSIGIENRRICAQKLPVIVAETKLPFTEGAQVAYCNGSHNTKLDVEFLSCYQTGGFNCETLIKFRKDRDGR